MIMPGFISINQKFELFQKLIVGDFKEEKNGGAALLQI
jgi:hypothetical protein